MENNNRGYKKEEEFFCFWLGSHIFQNVTTKSLALLKHLNGCVLKNKHNSS